MQWAEVETGAPHGLLSFYQGEPCHHNESPLFTLIDHLSRPFDCDPIVIRASRRRSNNMLTPTAWAAQVSRDLSGYTTSIAVFLAWLAQGAQAHDLRCELQPHISNTLTCVFFLIGIALALHIYRRSHHGCWQKCSTTHTCWLFTTIIDPAGRQHFQLSRPLQCTRC